MYTVGKYLIRLQKTAKVACFAVDVNVTNRWAPPTP